MKQYLTLLQDILDNGRDQPDRTGTGCRSVFGRQLRFDLSHGKIPLLTTKSVPLRAVAEELIWIMSGNTNNTYLEERDVHIWDAWALKQDVKIKQELTPSERHAKYCEMHGVPPEVSIQELWNADVKEARPSVKYGGEENGCERFLTEKGVPKFIETTIHRKGDLGPIYGAQMRDRNGVDQLSDLIASLRDNPFSRRHIIDLWNPEVLPQEGDSAEDNVMAGLAALPACHAFVQWHVDVATLEERKAHLCYLSMGETKQGQKIVEYLDDCEPGVKVDWASVVEQFEIPKYRLSCQLYQR